MGLKIEKRKKTKAKNVCKKYAGQLCMHSMFKIQNSYIEV